MLSNYLEQNKKLVDSFLQNIIEKISNKFNIDEDELKEFIFSTKEKSEKKTEKSEKKNENKGSSFSSMDMNTCNYVFVKGNNKGNKCGKKCSDGYCGLHNKPKKSPNEKIIPEAKKTEKKEKKELQLKKHTKLGVYYHEDTFLVFDVNTESKIVIGKIKNDKVKSLEEEDVELCKKYAFKFSKDKIKVEDESDKDSDSDNEDLEEKKKTKEVNKKSKDEDSDSDDEDLEEEKKTKEKSKEKTKEVNKKSKEETKKKLENITMNVDNSDSDTDDENVVNHNNVIKTMISKKILNNDDNDDSDDE